MSIKVCDIAEMIEEYAPIKYKEDYDNVGLMVGDRLNEVSSVLIALDCTMEVIEEAIRKGCSLIVTHHPLLFRKPSAITNDTLLGKKIIKLIKNNIDLYSCHTNLDIVKGGINDLLVDLLRQAGVGIHDRVEFLEQSKEIGVGRIFDLTSPISLEKLIEKVKAALELNTVRFSGNLTQSIHRVAVINGSGSDYMNLAKKNRADCIITGDTTYHYVSDLMEENISIIDAGHFSTEWPAMKKFSSILKNKFKSNNVNIEICVSDVNYDPYNYI
jgi:dinuclear metal center protein, YbgI/SA1388 family